MERNTSFPWGALRSIFGWAFVVGFLVLNPDFRLEDVPLVVKALFLAYGAFLVLGEHGESVRLQLFHTRTGLAAFVTLILAVMVKETWHSLPPAMILLTVALGVVVVFGARVPRS